MAFKPDLGFCVSGVAPDGAYIVGVDSEGAARDAGLIDGDAIVSLDGLPLVPLHRGFDWLSELTRFISAPTPLAQRTEVVSYAEVLRTC